MKRLLTTLLFIALGAVPWGWAASANITTNGATCATATSCLVVNLPQDKGGATLVLSGTWTGTVQFEATGDGGVTWVAVNVLPLNSTSAVTSTSANGTWQVNTAGFTGLRMRSSASMTGTAVATITYSAASARLNGGGGGGGTTVNDLASSPHLFVNSFAAPNLGTAQPSASDLSTGALVNGITATTQAITDATTKLATDAFVWGQKVAAPGGTLTVATLPGSPIKGQIASVSDGSSSNDCTSGGGATLVTCQYNGSAWTQFGAGGGTSGTINNATQYKRPYYSAAGSANTLSGDACTTDGSGNETCTSYTTNGTTPGAVSVTAGSGNIPALPANSAGFAAPVSGGTSYLIKFPATITAGIPLFGTPGTVDGVNESAMTVLANPLPVANGGSGSSSPSLVAGSGISIGGSWPNQTVTNTGVAGTGYSWNYVAKNTNYNVATGDFSSGSTFGNWLVFVSALSNVTYTLPVTSGLAVGDCVRVLNINAVHSLTINITTNSASLNGDATDNMILGVNQGAEICVSSTVSSTYISKDIPPAVATNTQTASYSVTLQDIGKLIIMNCSSACTVTLPAAPPSFFKTQILSIGSTVATVALSSLDYNGGASAPVLNSYRILSVYSDGTNYFGEAPLVAGSNVTFTPSANGFSIASSGSGGSPGGSTNAVQYNAGSSTFGGVSLATSTDPQVVTQTNSGVPATMRPISVTGNGGVAGFLSNVKIITLRAPATAGSASANPAANVDLQSDVSADNSSVCGAGGNLTCYIVPANRIACTSAVYWFSTSGTPLIIWNDDSTPTSSATVSPIYYQAAATSAADSITYCLKAGHALGCNPGTASTTSNCYSTLYEGDATSAISTQVIGGNSSTSAQTLYAPTSGTHFAPMANRNNVFPTIACVNTTSTAGNYTLYALPAGQTQASQYEVLSATALGAPGMASNYLPGLYGGGSPAAQYTVTFSSSYTNAQVACWVTGVSDTGTH